MKRNYKIHSNTILGFLKGHRVHFNTILQLVYPLISQDCQIFLANFL